MRLIDAPAGEGALWPQSPDDTVPRRPSSEACELGEDLSELIGA
jgi:hypothetical protein